MLLVKKIQNLCHGKDTSLPKLEKELKFGKGSIYNWDKNSPSVNKIIKVAEYFGVSIDSLLLDKPVNSDVQNSA